MEKLQTVLAGLNLGCLRRGKSPKCHKFARADLSCLIIAQKMYESQQTNFAIKEKKHCKFVALRRHFNDKCYILFTHSSKLCAYKPNLRKALTCPLYVPIMT